MIEKWDPVLGAQNLWDPVTPSISGSHGSPGPPGPLDPQTPWDLRTSGPWGSYLYRLKFRI